MFSKLKKWLNKNEFLKSVFSVGSGNLLAQIIQVITVPLVSRIFTDAEHGQYSLIVSSAALIITFCTLGLTSAIMVPKEDEESNQVLLTALSAAALIDILFCGGVLIASPWWKLFKIDMNYALAVMLMFLHIIATTLSSVLYTAVNRAKLNRVLMYNPIIGACATLIITIPLGLLGVGAASFIIADILSKTASIIHMLRHLNPFRTHFSPRIAWNTVKKYKRFVIFQCPANMINGFARQSPTQILGRCFSNGLLGNYAMCMKLLEYPSHLIAAPINTVYFRTANQYVHEGKDLSAFTYKLIRIVLLVAFIPIIVAIFFAKPVFVFVLGKQWAEAGDIASILIFPIVLKFCGICISYCRVTLGKQKYNLIFGIIELIVDAGSLIAGYFLTHDFIKTIIIYAVFSTVIRITDLGLDFYCLGKHFKRYVLFIAVYSLIIVLVFVLKFLIFKHI